MMIRIIQSGLLVAALALTSCGDTKTDVGDNDSVKKPVRDLQPAVSSAFDEVKAKARVAKKRPVVVFTGSDWCRYSQLMKATVLDSKEWSEFAEKRLEVYVADFPMKTK